MMSKHPDHHPQPTTPVFLHQYQLLTHHPICHEGCLSTNCRTEILVVFDEETQRRYSAVRIVLLCDAAMGVKRTLHLRQGLVTHSFWDRAHRAPLNDPALKKLFLSFHIVPCRCDRECYDLDYSISDDDLQTSFNTPRVSQDCVISDTQHPMASDTIRLSVVFQHSNWLHSSPSPLKPADPCSKPEHKFDPGEYTTTCVTRVIPSPNKNTDDSAPSRPKKTIRHLPTELVMKILDIATDDSPDWQRDLLSFAQVCRQWSCAMKTFLARLASCDEHADTHALARTLCKTPTLGRDVHALVVNQHDHAWECCSSHYSAWMRRSTFFPSLATILGATKNLQRLHLSQGYSAHAKAFYSALPELSNLHTLTIRRPPGVSRKYRYHSISTAQLARCMARWPALTSLTVEDLEPEHIGPADRLLLLRPPACALTHLSIRFSHISDTDLLFLTASSAKTLTQVTLNGVHGLTDDGLYTFLDGVCRNVSAMRMRLVGLRRKGSVGRALGTLADKVRCL